MTCKSFWGQIEILFRKTRGEVKKEDEYSSPISQKRDAESVIQSYVNDIQLLIDNVSQITDKILVDKKEKVFTDHQNLAAQAKNIIKKAYPLLLAAQTRFVTLQEIIVNEKTNQSSTSMNSERNNHSDSVRHHKSNLSTDNTRTL